MKTLHYISAFFLVLTSSLMFACNDSSSADDDNDSSSSVESSSSAKSSASKGSSSSIEDPSSLFKTRVPDSLTLNCDNFGETSKETFAQQDWICSFDYDGNSGYFYLQASPTSCAVLMSAMPEFSTDKADFYLNGSYVDIDSSAYDWGGNHRNDAIVFIYQKKLYKYYHSSFGFGWRSCNKMDCLQVYELDGETLIEDGCTSKRTLPIVCRRADESGKFGSFEDTFERCSGDTGDDDDEALGDDE